MGTELGKVTKTLSVFTQNAADRKLKKEEREKSDRELRILGLVFEILGVTVFFLGGGGLYKASKEYKTPIGAARIAASVVLMLLGLDIVSIGHEIRSASPSKDSATKTWMTTVITQKKNRVQVIGDAMRHVVSRKLLGESKEYTWTEYCKHTLIIGRIVKRAAKYLDPV